MHNGCTLELFGYHKSSHSTRPAAIPVTHRLDSQLSVEHILMHIKVLTCICQVVNIGYCCCRMHFVAI